MAGSLPLVVFSMLDAKIISQPGTLLGNDEITTTLQKGLGGKFKNQRVLVLIPDHTRSLPLPFLFCALVDVLRNTKQLDFMVALGTHPPLSEDNLTKLAGLTHDERTPEFKHVC